jgi:hypothetical protein
MRIKLFFVQAIFLATLLFSVNSATVVNDAIWQLKFIEALFVFTALTTIAVIILVPALYFIPRQRMTLRDIKAMFLWWFMLASQRGRNQLKDIFDVMHGDGYCEACQNPKAYGIDDSGLSLCKECWDSAFNRCERCHVVRSAMALAKCENGMFYCRPCSRMKPTVKLETSFTKTPV